MEPLCIKGVEDEERLKSKGAGVRFSMVNLGGSGIAR